MFKPLIISSREIASCYHNYSNNVIQKQINDRRTGEPLKSVTQPIRGAQYRELTGGPRRPSVGPFLAVTYRCLTTAVFTPH